MANLLFSSGFEGNVALAAPSNVTGANGWQNFTGLDTGDLWGGTAAVQLRGMRGDIGGATVKGIQTTTGPDGDQTRALNLGVNGNDGVQSPLLIQPRESPDAFTISQWVKLPEDLGSILGPEGWLAGFGEWKSAGDFRVVTNISVDDQGRPYWSMKWDTDANGNVGMQTFWSAENREVEVPLGEWMKVEFHTDRGDGNGRVWLKVNGETVFDRTGDNIGQNGAPIDRIFVASSYASNAVDVLVDDIQVWDGVPSGGAAGRVAPQAVAAEGRAETDAAGGGDDGGAGEAIRGTDGPDRLAGGSGPDIFAFGRNDGWDWIAGFDPGTDRLRLEGMDRSDISWTGTSWPGVGPGIEVKFGDGAGGGVFLAGVASLGAGDFVFG